MLNNRVNTVKNCLIRQNYSNTQKPVPSGQLSASSAKTPFLFQPSRGMKMNVDLAPSCANFVASILKSKMKNSICPGVRASFEEMSHKNYVDYSKTISPEIG